MKKSDPLFSDLRSIGIFFDETTTKNSNPEETLISSLDTLTKDSKTLFLVANWVSLYSSLIHTERLVFLIKKRNLSLPALMILGGLCRYGSHKSKKLDLVCRTIKKITKIKKISIAEYIELPVRMGQCASNPDFKEFGLTVPPIVDLSSKILPIDIIAKTNLHIRMRILFGASWRAEIATHLLINGETTFYKLRKELGCTNETALRIGKQLRLIKSLGKPIW